MAQFLRPDSNITQTAFTGGFAEIDEVTWSGTDFAWSANNTAAVLEVGLSNPSATPGAGTVTVRYRAGKVNNGTLDSGGNGVSVTPSLYQGTTLIATGPSQFVAGTFTGYTWTPDTTSVTDWNALRLRFDISASGGSPANRRGGAIAWAEVETPDAAVAVTGTMAATVSTSLSASIAGGAEVSGYLAATHTETLTASASGTVSDPAISGAMGASYSPALASAMSGAVVVSGSASAAYSAALTASFDVSVSVSGDGSASFNSTLTATASGSVLVSGAMAGDYSQTLTFAGSGSVASGISGALGAAFSPALSFDAAGTVGIAGSLDAARSTILAASISGTVSVSGAMSATRSTALTASMAGTVGTSTVTGTMAATFAAEQPIRGRPRLRTTLDAVLRII